MKRDEDFDRDFYRPDSSPRERGGNLDAAGCCVFLVFLLAGFWWTILTFGVDAVRSWFPKGF